MTPTPRGVGVFLQTGEFTMIHQYKMNGYNIVIDTYSGSIHSVDEIAYDMIADYHKKDEQALLSELLEKYGGRDDVTEDELKQCRSDIEELIKEGKLFSDSRDAHVTEEILQSRPVVIKAMCLHVAHTCNLNCDYCFASQGRYHGERAVMSYETGKRALDFLVENSGNRRNLEVDFFGGEPLMNFEVVKRLVAYARSMEKRNGKNFRFTLTTNGVLIDDDVIDFCNREMSNVVLSLDGRKEIHDKHRVDYQGRGSYDTVVPKFREFVRRRTNGTYYMRGTYTHENPDFTNDIFHMADLGFTELSMEPVVTSPGDASALTEEDLPVLFEQYELLAKEMLRREKEGRPFEFYHYMLDLSKGPCLYKRITGCGSGTEYIAVTPSGEIYPCHQFVGDKKYLLGDIFNGITNTDLRNQFRRCNVFSHKECLDCWANLYCSGGCAANAYHATGDINGVYEYGCRLFKKRIECAIMLQVAKQEEV